MTISDGTFTEYLNDTQDYLYQWHEQVRLDFRFYALKQWVDADQKFLEDSERPALVFDKTRPIIDSVAGSEVMNRYEPKFTPRMPELDGADPWLADAAYDVYKWIRQYSNMENHESSMFLSNLICGVGCTNSYIDYEDNPNGSVLTKRVPISEMGWDPHSVEPNLADSKYVIRDKWVDEDEIAAMFGPEAVEGIKAASEADAGNQDSMGFFGKMYMRLRDDSTKSAYKTGKNLYYNARTKKIRLYEMQRWVRESHVRIFLPDLLMQQGGAPGQAREDIIVPKDEAKEKIDELNNMVMTFNMNPQRQDMGIPEMPGVKYIDNFPVKKFYKSYHVGREAIEDEKMDLPCFSYQFTTAYEDWSEDWSDSKRRYFFGLMRPMRDPQRYANKFFSQAVHMFATNPKGALLYESDMFEDVKKASTDWNKASGMIPVLPGKLNRPNKPYEQLSSHVSMNQVSELLAHATNSISESAGVSAQYFVGAVADLKRTAAQSIESIQEQTLTTVSGPFDSLRLYKKLHGRLMLGFIQNYVDDIDITRVLGPERAQAFLQVMRTEDLTRMYDIAVEEAPTSQNKQAEIFGKLMQTNFIPQLMEMGIPVPPTLAKYFPFPPDINTDFQGALEEAQEMMQAHQKLATMEAQMQMMQMQMEMMMMQQGGPPQGDPNAMPPEQGGEQLPPEGPPPEEIM